VVGIAAKSDEHLEILSNLTNVLGDVAEDARLANTADPADIANRLSSGRMAKPAPAVEALPENLPHHFDIVIDSPHGLHARPATALVDIAKGFESTIRIRRGDRAGDAKSLIAILNLGVGSGSTIRVMADGPDAENALTTLRSAIEAGLEEEAEAAPAIQWEGRTVSGIAASPGIAIGPSRQLQRGRIVVAATAQDPSAEIEKLDRAFEAAKRELGELYNEVKERAGAGKAAIFRAHAEFLEDPGLAGAACDLIRTEGRSAGSAWQRSYEARADTLAGQQDPLLPGRALDLRNVGRRVLRTLAERIEDEQAAAYTTMTKALNALPIIIRTLDIGGDKEVPYMAMP
jgi:phosphotransferase system HPr (HPr) family protein